MAPSPPLNICGPRIRQARKKLGFDQSELAAALEVDYQIKLTQSDISEIERQQRSLKDFELDAMVSDRLSAIARLLEVTPLWLLRGE